MELPTGARPTRRGNRARGELYELVSRWPGLTLRELGQRIHLSGAQVRYHLAVLERDGRVRRVLVGGMWHHVRGDANPKAHRVRLLLEKDPKVRRLAALVDDAGTPARDAVREIMKTYKLTRSGAWGVLRRALRSGILRRERTGHMVTLHRSLPPLKAGGASPPAR